jgi:hypothetical protein
MQAASQEPKRYPSLFTIIVPVVEPDENGVPIQICDLIERYFSFIDIPRVFCGVVLHFHGLIVGTKK